MRQERILNALGQVDEAYILEAEPGRYPGRRRSGRMLAVLAACVGLLLALSTVSGQPGVAGSGGVERLCGGL